MTEWQGLQVLRGATATWQLRLLLPCRSGKAELLHPKGLDMAARSATGWIASSFEALSLLPTVASSSLVVSQ